MTGGENVVRSLVSVISVSLILLAVSVGCSKAPDAASSAAGDAPKRTGLESITAADPSNYAKFRDRSGWQNPYLVVREDGIGFVDLSNNEIRILKPDEIPAHLASLPPSSWPYGRVVLVAEAVPKNPTEQTKARLRENRGLLAGTLKELDVQIRESP
jgi:hypothetical protein